LDHCAPNQFIPKKPDHGPNFGPNPNEKSLKFPGNGAYKIKEINNEKSISPE